MKGSLQIKGRKYYVVINYKDDFGNWKKKWISTGLDSRNNKTRANQALKEIEAGFRPETIVAQTDAEILFSDYLEQWLENHKKNVRLNTYAGYKLLLKKITKYFKNHGTKLKDLKPIHIQTLYNVWAKHGMTGSTMLKYHNVIRKALQHAMKFDLVPTNVADKVDRPRVNSFQARFLSENEMAEIFKAAEGHLIEVPVKLAAIYGLRRSEVMGLKWSAIDFEHKTIEIKHQVLHTKIGGVVKILRSDTLKNKSSFRTLPLTPQAEKILRDAQQRIEKNNRLYGSGYCLEDSEYVCVNELGKLISPDRVTDSFKHILKKAGVRKARFHDLRHSCASLLLAAGVQMKSIQEWMGHSTFSTTADIYSHLDHTSKLKSASALTNIFSFGQVEDNLEIQESVDNEIARLQEQLERAKKRKRDFEM